MTIERPIFIVGAGRSGSTVLHQILAEHPQVVWLSGVTSRWPGHPVRNRIFMQALDIPVVGAVLRQLATPGESYPFWDLHYRGFSRPFRDLIAGDLMPATSRSVREAFEKMTTHRRDRLLLKITGWPRLAFLNAIFPDARFIHLVRDGRAVAASLLNVPFWSGWQGPEKWRWGSLSAEMQAQWAGHDYSFIILAALQWKILMDAMECARASIPAGSFLQVHYEALCSAPRQTLEEISDFARLPWSRRLDKAIRAHALKSRNEKWRSQFTGEQQAALAEVLAEPLSRYGYRL